jgi:vancomycin permeability regulator SanA
MPLKPAALAVESTAEPGIVSPHRRNTATVTDYAIIFGAAVREDGRLSPTLHRRIQGALAWAQDHPEGLLIPTGGIGPSGLTEAEAMQRDLLIAGIAPERIIPETQGRDTLESVRLCDAILRQRGDCRSVAICSSPFHQPRCALLFRLLGYRVARPPMPSDRGRVLLRKYARYVLKEIFATPYDALLLLLRRHV